jgi:hypothetical protein
VGSEEGCGGGRLERGGDAGVAAARMGGGGGMARSGFRGKMKGRRLKGGPACQRGEAVGQAGSKGGGRKVGRGWAENRKWPKFRT